MKSARIKLDKPKQFPGFTMDGLWRSLGLADVAAGPRTHDAPVVEVAAEPEAGPRDWLEEAEKLTDWKSLNRLVAAAAASKADEETLAAIRLRRNEMEKPEVTSA